MTAPDNYVEADASWLDRLAAAEQKYPKPAPPASQVPANKEDSQKNANDYDSSVKMALKAMPMLEYYRKHFDPAHERTLAGDEINVSCFNHIFHGNGDQHPQFNINQRLNTYICHACKIKGDMLDLIANVYGLADANLRCPDGNVDEVVRRAGAEYLGAESYISATGVRMMMLPDSNPATADEQFDRVEGFPTFNMGGGAVPFDVPSLDLPPDETSDYMPTGPVPTLDWRNILDPNGFSYKYMERACQDDSVEEFHLYNSFIALGMVAGRELTLEEGRPVRGNAFICDMGPTGAGKSSAASILMDLLHEAIPYKESSGSGVMLPSEAGSGESLVDTFKQRIETPPDPSTGRKTPVVSYLDNITALLEFDELSSLMNRIMRQGNTIESVLQAIYDCKRTVGTKSRGQGEVKAWYPYGSMLTTSQPKRIADLVKKEQVSSGFANRLIYVFGEEKPESAFTPTLPPISGIANELRDTATWCQLVRNTVKRITWEPGTRDRYQEFHRAVMDPIKKNDPQRDLIARITLTMKKHILWLCLDVRSATVTMDIVERAILFWDYLLASYKTVGGHMMTTEMGEREEEIMHALKRAFDMKQKWPSKNELRRDHLGVKKWTLRDLDVMMKDLVTNGHVEEMPPEPGRGNKKPRYRVAAE